MYYNTKLIIILGLLLTSIGVFAQKGSNQLTQTIRGIVIDKNSSAPLSYVSIGLLDLPEIGVTTDDNGEFVLKNIPLGRHNLQATSVGYE